MGTKILKVLYEHTCDVCGKKKKQKSTLPKGWTKFGILLFCKEECKAIYTMSKSESRVKGVRRLSTKYKNKGTKHHAAKQG